MSMNDVSSSAYLLSVQILTTLEIDFQKIISTFIVDPMTFNNHGLGSTGLEAANLHKKFPYCKNSSIFLPPNRNAKLRRKQSLLRYPDFLGSRERFVLTLALVACPRETPFPES